MGEKRNSGSQPRPNTFCLAYGLITKGNGEVILTEEKHMTLSVGGGQAGQGYPCVMVLEHHPNDSRVKVAEDGICQTLNKRMGTGGQRAPGDCV